MKDIPFIKKIAKASLILGPKLAAAGAAGAKSKKMYDEDDITAGVVACSQSVGLAKDIVPVQILFDRIMTDAEEIIKRLSNL